MTLCAMRLRTSVTQNIFTRETCINLYMQIFSFPLQRLSLPVHKEFKQLFVYANEWKPYSLSACSVFVALTDQWTTTIIDIISSTEVSNNLFSYGHILEALLPRYKSTPIG